MIIKLYNNTSAPNYVLKSLLSIDTLEGVLRSPTSVIDPIVTIERSTPTGFNYIQIPEFNRYYFVTGVSTDVNGLIVVSCHVDVLMTYASQIKQCSAIIKRQENKYNLYLDDGIFKAYQNPKHRIIKFQHGFNDFSYILALAGNSDS